MLWSLDIHFCQYKNLLGIPPVLCYTFPHQSKGSVIEKYRRGFSTTMQPDILPTLRQITLYWFPLLLYSLLIFFISSLSHPEDHFPDPYFWGFENDKVAHGIEFAVLGILYLRVFQGGLGKSSLSYPALWAILAATLFGISDEFHQYFVPNRDIDLWDVVADFTGATLAIVAWSYFQRSPIRFLTGPQS